MNKKVDENLWNLTKDVDYILSSIVNRNPLVENSVKTIPFIDDYKTYLMVLYDPNNFDEFVNSLLELTDKVKPLVTPLILKIFDEFYNKRMYLLPLFFKIGAFASNYKLLTSIRKNFVTSSDEEKNIFYNKLDSDAKYDVKIPVYDGRILPVKYAFTINSKSETLYEYYVNLLRSIWGSELSLDEIIKYLKQNMLYNGTDSIFDETFINVNTRNQLAFLVTSEIQKFIGDGTILGSSFSINFFFGKLPYFYKTLNPLIQGYTDTNEYKLYIGSNFNFDQYIDVGQTYFKNATNKILQSWKSYIINKQYSKLLDDLKYVIEQFNLPLTNFTSELNNIEDTFTLIESQLDYINIAINTNNKENYNYNEVIQKIQAIPYFNNTITTIITNEITTIFNAIKSIPPLQLIFIASTRVNEYLNNSFDFVSELNALIINLFLNDPAAFKQVVTITDTTIIYTKDATDYRNLILNVSLYDKEKLIEYINLVKYKLIESADSFLNIYSTSTNIVCNELGIVYNDSYNLRNLTEFIDSLILFRPSVSILIDSYNAEHPDNQLILTEQNIDKVIFTILYVINYGLFDKNKNELNTNLKLIVEYENKNENIVDRVDFFLKTLNLNTITGLIRMLNQNLTSFDDIINILRKKNETINKENLAITAELKKQYRFTNILPDFIRNFDVSAIYKQLLPIVGLPQRTEPSEGGISSRFFNFVTELVQDADRDYQIDNDTIDYNKNINPIYLAKSIFVKIYGNYLDDFGNPKFNDLPLVSNIPFSDSYPNWNNISMKDKEILEIFEKVIEDFILNNTNKYNKVDLSVYKNKVLVLKFLFTLNILFSIEEFAKKQFENKVSVVESLKSLLDSLKQNFFGIGVNDELISLDPVAKQALDNLYNSLIGNNIEDVDGNNIDRMIEVLNVLFNFYNVDNLRIEKINQLTNLTYNKLFYNLSELDIVPAKLNGWYEGITIDNETGIVYYDTLPPNYIPSKLLYSNITIINKFKQEEFIKIISKLNIFNSTINFTQITGYNDFVTTYFPTLAENEILQIIFIANNYISIPVLNINDTTNLYTNIDNIIQQYKSLLLTNNDTIVNPPFFLNNNIYSDINILNYNYLIDNVICIGSSTFSTSSSFTFYISEFKQILDYILDNTNVFLNNVINVDIYDGNTLTDYKGIVINKQQYFDPNEDPVILITSKDYPVNNNYRVEYYDPLLQKVVKVTKNIFYKDIKTKDLVDASLFTIGSVSTLASHNILSDNFRLIAHSLLYYYFIIYYIKNKYNIDIKSPFDDPSIYINNLRNIDNIDDNILEKQEFLQYVDENIIASNLAIYPSVSNKILNDIKIFNKCTLVNLTLGSNPFYTDQAVILNYDNKFNNTEDLIVLVTSINYDPLALPIVFKDPLNNIITNNIFYYDGYSPLTNNNNITLLYKYYLIYYLKDLQLKFPFIFSDINFNVAPNIYRPLEDIITEFLTKLSEVEKDYILKKQYNDVIKNYNVLLTIKELKDIIANNINIINDIGATITNTDVFDLYPTFNLYKDKFDDFRATFLSIYNSVPLENINVSFSTIIKSFYDGTLNTLYSGSKNLLVPLDIIDIIQKGRRAYEFGLNIFFSYVRENLLLNDIITSVNLITVLDKENSIIQRIESCNKDLYDRVLLIINIDEDFQSKWNKNKSIITNIELGFFNSFYYSTELPFLINENDCIETSDVENGDAFIISIFNKNDELILKKAFTIASGAGELIRTTLNTIIGINILTLSTDLSINILDYRIMIKLLPAIIIRNMPEDNIYNLDIVNNDTTILFKLLNQLNNLDYVLEFKDNYSTYHTLFKQSLYKRIYGIRFNKCIDDIKLNKEKILYDCSFVLNDPYDTCYSKLKSCKKSFYDYDELDNIITTYVIMNKIKIESIIKHNPHIRYIIEWNAINTPVKYNDIYDLARAWVKYDSFIFRKHILLTKVISKVPWIMTEYFSNVTIQNKDYLIINSHKVKLNDVMKCIVSDFIRPIKSTEILNRYDNYGIEYKESNPKLLFERIDFDIQNIIYTEIGIASDFTFTNLTKEVYTSRITYNLIKSIYFEFDDVPYLTKYLFDLLGFKIKQKVLNCDIVLMKYIRKLILYANYFELLGYVVKIKNDFRYLYIDKDIKECKTIKENALYKIDIIENAQILESLLQEHFTSWRCGNEYVNKHIRNSLLELLNDYLKPYFDIEKDKRKITYKMKSFVTNNVYKHYLDLLSKMFKVKKYYKSFKVNTKNITYFGYLILMLLQSYKLRETIRSGYSHIIKTNSIVFKINKNFGFDLFIENDVVIPLTEYLITKNYTVKYDDQNRFNLLYNFKLDLYKYSSISVYFKSSHSCGKVKPSITSLSQLFGYLKTKYNVFELRKENNNYLIYT